MLLLQQIAVAIVVASCGIFAAPTSDTTLTIGISKRKDQFAHSHSGNVNYIAVNKHLSSLKVKYQTTLASYEKNTGKSHPLANASSANKKRATGTVALIDVQNSLWHGAITLGGQTSQCDFDTGSADTVVEPAAYKPGSTATNTGHTFSASYGDGTMASGKVYTDTVSVGGLTATGASIGASSTSFLSASEGSTGICGMSYPSITSFGSGSTPFFDALIKKKVVSTNAFTFTLKATGSTLFLGGVAPNIGTPLYSPVSNQGYWQISSSSISKVTTSSIIDTGTSLIVAPTATARSIFRSLGIPSFTQDGTLYGYYNCNAPPSVTYKIGSFSKVLSPSTLSIGTTNNGQCVLSIIGEDIGINAVIAGDSFLENVHAVFDRTNNRVGFSSQ
jgi:cathepsin D